jgi:ribonuclease P protein component
MKNTLKSRRDFDFNDAGFAAMPAIIVKWKPKRLEAPRYGMVATKKTFKTAVKRNRARRLIRAWLAECGLPAACDIIVIARAPILETGKKDGVAQMKKALKKAKI